MKRFITFGKIKDFKSIHRDIRDTAQFIEYDEELQEPIFDRSIALPKLLIEGTEKIHGTNASVCMGGPKGEFWVQSRKNIIDVDSDNSGCALAVYGNENHPGTENSWISIIQKLAKIHEINMHEYIITVFYEWCGGNIQKNSALSSCDKAAIIFKHFKVSPYDETSEESASWFNTESLDVQQERIYNIVNFPTYTIEIDFNEPSSAHNEMIKLVDVVESASPVGKQFGQDANIGEGIVFEFRFKDTLHKFKVKGTKHSKSKVKTLKPVDDALEQRKQEEAQRCTPAWRLEQGIQEVFGDKEPTKERTGDFLKWVQSDISLEESGNIVDAGLEVKSVMQITSRIARNWFFEQLDF